MTAPASLASRSRRRWIDESGTSRGTRTSGRRSFSATAPARWMSVVDVPRAMWAAVDSEHGQMTAASGNAEPLDTAAARSAG